MAEALEIIEEINALTTHCRPPLMDVDQRSLWQRDWCRDLAKYPIEAIQSAFRQWRQGESTKFPTPGQILPMIERATGGAARRDETYKPWSYGIEDGEYRALSLRDKIRHHKIAAQHCRMKANPMPSEGTPVKKADMPEVWQDWRRRAENHEAEAQRLKQSIGTLEARA